MRRDGGGLGAVGWREPRGRVKGDWARDEQAAGIGDRRWERTSSVDGRVPQKRCWSVPQRVCGCGAAANPGLASVDVSILSCLRRPGPALFLFLPPPRPTSRGQAVLLLTRSPAGKRLARTGLHTIECVWFGDQDGCSTPSKEAQQSDIQSRAPPEDDIYPPPPLSLIPFPILLGSPPAGSRRRAPQHDPKPARCAAPRNPHPPPLYSSPPSIKQTRRCTSGAPQKQTSAPPCRFARWCQWPVASPRRGPGSS